MSLNDLERVFHPNFAATMGRNAQFDFIVRDPFNNTYNPAKVTSSKKGLPFNKNFESALEKLLIKQKFIC